MTGNATLNISVSGAEEATTDELIAAVRKEVAEVLKADLEDINISVGGGNWTIRHTRGDGRVDTYVCTATGGYTSATMPNRDLVIEEVYDPDAPTDPADMTQGDYAPMWNELVTSKFVDYTDKFTITVVGEDEDNNQIIEISGTVSSRNSFDKDEQVPIWGGSQYEDEICGWGPVSIGYRYVTGGTDYDNARKDLDLLSSTKFVVIPLYDAVTGNMKFILAGDETDGYAKYNEDEDAQVDKVLTFNGQPTVIHYNLTWE